MISQIDGEGRATTFEYNAANKLLRKIDHGGRTGAAGKYVYADHKVEKYTYYPNGLLHTKLDRNGNTTTYIYDCHGRMTSQVVGDESISYTYDNNGNTLTMKDSTGITVRAYDELNRVVTKSVPNIGTAVFRYDIIYTHSDGKKYVGESSKDPKGNLTIKYYDGLGRLRFVASDQQASQFTTYEYDGNGNRESIKYPSGVMEEYTYYKNNLLKTLVNKNASGTVLESYSYTYDSANNQIIKTDAKGVTEYSYDALNRLSTVKEPSGKLTEYKFDMAGNRASETVTIGTQITTTLYEYNEQNRMISTTVEVNNQRNITKYSYDGNGNLTSKTGEIFKKIDPANPPTPHFGMYIVGQSEGGVTEHAKQIASNICYYSYDKFNRMIKASPVGASAAEYKYNGEGLRVEKIADGKTTRYMYEYDKVVLETDGRGRQTARNVQGLNPISRTVDGSTMYYLYNGHADVTALIDGAGAIQGTYYYDAFGNIAESTGTLDNPFTFAGYHYDKETGLYYLNTRMYDPKTARFMQEDSYRGEFNDPLSLNLYTYCYNEPIMYSDPTGHARVTYSADGGGSYKKKTTSGNKVSSDSNVRGASSKNTSTKTTTKTTKDINVDRIEQGTNKIVNGGALMFVGALAIASVATVLTGGAATPLLVTVVASATVLTGGAAVTMGAADVIEGQQDIIYGAIGSDRESKNMIKDNVFKGNEEAYYYAEGWAVTLASAGVAYVAVAPKMQINSNKTCSNVNRNVTYTFEDDLGNDKITIRNSSNTPKITKSTLEIPEGGISGDNTENMLKGTGNTAYRYVSEGELSVIKKTGTIPNTDRAGNLKDVFVSPGKYDTAADAEKALQIGKQNPFGATESPTHRIEFNTSGIKFRYGGNVEGGT